MTFGIRHHPRLTPSPGFVAGPAKGRIRCKAHGSFVECVIQIPPQQHSVIPQNFFFVVVGQVLQDNIGIWCQSPHGIRDSTPQRHTGRIVIPPGPGIAQGIGLGKAFGQIKAVTIHPVFGQPMPYHPVQQTARCRTLVIEIIAHIEIVLGHGIEIRAVGRRTIVSGIPPQLGQRTLAKSMVHNNIHHHRNTPSMAGIDEGLEIVLGAIGLVSRQMKAGVVAP